ncbi:MAG: GTPase ObgE [Verrucomicrobiae bacterium]|nr:GTPase ObgE [Verrucomicrobiae bacterium]
MFVDHLKIFAKAGDGGEPCISFRREKYVPKGGPDGGDGGRGGDVILEVDPHTDSLRALFYRQQYKAPRGQNGMGQRKTGKGGKPVVLKVPPGTRVYRIPPPETPHFDESEGPETEFVIEGEDGERHPESEASFLEEIQNTDPDDIFEGDEFDEEDDEDDEDEMEEIAPEMIADLTQAGEKFVLCRGGAGGLGNQHFASPTNRAPIESRPSEPGEEGWFFIELRQIADVGLVGFPNAGKSTLLRAISNATPKVAAYPFTTLKPMVGVVDFGGFVRATVADIPGIIEGAHANVGLGHEFLRHITRCRLLLFVVDTAAIDGRDAISDLQNLRTEVKLYDEELAKRPWLIVANKLDLEISEQNLSYLQQRFPKQEIIAISADTGQGIDGLKDRLKELVGTRPD